jgi:hypothetical protein
MLTGAEKCIALDVTRYADTSKTLELFDELVELLSQRMPLAGQPFPSDILTDQRLDRCLQAERVYRLRSRIAGGAIEYIVPWDGASVIDTGTVDWVVSTSVLEHVDDVPATWAAIAAWMKPGGISAHQIDFRSHARALEWNGHWAYPDWLWRWIRGARSPINRQPLSRHLEAARAAGLRATSVVPSRRADGLTRRDLDSSWKWMTDEDLTCESAYILAVAAL